MANVATSQPSTLPKGKVDASHNDAEMEQQTPEAEDISLQGSADDAQVEAQSNGAEEFADRASVADQLGSVDGEGNVVAKDGNILGKVDDEVPKGSVVDTEGNVLDAEGSVVGSAKSVAKDATSEAAQVSLALLTLATSTYDIYRRPKTSSLKLSIFQFLPERK